MLESEREMSEEDVPVDKSANIDAVRCHRHRNSKDIFFTRGNCEHVIRLHCTKCCCKTSCIVAVQKRREKNSSG